jgi:drug/metabolite transporter (DMT)-like permease
MVNKTKNIIKNSWLYKYLVGIAFAVVVFFMGINYLFINLSNKELPPLWSGSLRYFLTSMLLLSFTYLSGLKLPKGKVLAGAVVYGVLAYGINAGLLYWSLNYINPEIASIIYSTTPLSTLLFASIFKIEKTDRISLISSIAVIVGVLIIFNENSTTTGYLFPLFGVLIASVSAAFSNIVIKQLPQSNPVTFNAVAMLTGGTSLLISSTTVNEQAVIPSLLSTYLSLSWLVLSTSIMSVLILWIIKHWKPSRMAYTAVLAPIVTIVTASVINDQTFKPTFVLGALIILLSVSFNLKHTHRNVMLTK